MPWRFTERASCSGADTHGRSKFPTSLPPVGAAASPDGLGVVLGPPVVDYGPPAVQAPLPQQTQFPENPKAMSFYDLTHADAPIEIVEDATRKESTPLRCRMTVIPATSRIDRTHVSSSSKTSIQLKLHLEVDERSQTPRGADLKNLRVSGLGHTSAACIAADTRRRRRTVRRRLNNLIQQADGDEDVGDMRIDLGPSSVPTTQQCVVRLGHVPENKEPSTSYSFACSDNESRIGHMDDAPVEHAARVVTVIAAATTCITPQVAAGTDAESLDGGTNGAASPSAVIGTALPSGRCLPYRPYIKRASLFTKIPGYNPAQITPGFEQRLARVVPVLGGVSSSRRLAWVYVRSGCVELLLEDEEWGTISTYGSEGNEAEEVEVHVGAQQQQERASDEQQATSAIQAAVGNTGASGSHQAGDLSGSASAVAGYSCGHFKHCDVNVSPLSYCSGGSARRSNSHSSSLSSMDLAAIIQALQLRDEREVLVSEDVNEDGAVERMIDGVWDSNQFAVEGAEIDGAPQVGPSGSAAVASTEKQTCVGVAGEAESGQVESKSAAPPASQLATANCRAPSVAESIVHRTPFLLGSDGERQTGIRVVAIQPRVLLIPTAPSAQPLQGSSPLQLTGRLSRPLEPTPSAENDGRPGGWGLQNEGTSGHQGPPPHYQNRRHARNRSRVGRGEERGGGRGGRGGGGQSHPNVHTVIQTGARDNFQNTLLYQVGTFQQQGDSRPSGAEDMALRRGSAAAGAEAAVATLRAAVHCSAAVAVEEGPRGLEVLLRSHGRYLPLRARWRVGTTRPQQAAAGAEPDEGGGGTALGSSAYPAGGLLGASGGAVPRPAPDAILGLDVNQHQLLELDLFELPRRPGIALVDFRWRDRPCRVVPLVLTTNTAVAAELQAAVAGWSRPQAELDELLLDYGTWEFHVSHAVRSADRPSSRLPLGLAAQSSTGLWNASASVAEDGGGGISPSPLHLSTARLLDLSNHLLRYANACGWVHIAGHVQDQLYCLRRMTQTGPMAPLNMTAGPKAVAAVMVSTSANPSAASSRDVAATAAIAAAGAAAPWTLAPAGMTFTVEDGSCAAAVSLEATEVLEGGSSEELEEEDRGEPSCKAPLAMIVSVRGGASSGVGGGNGMGGHDRGDSSTGLRRNILQRLSAGGGDCSRGQRVAWASAVFLPSLGFSRTMSPAEEKAFKVYADPWICKLSRVLLFFDVSSLFVLLIRERHQLFAGTSLTVLASCWGSMATIVACFILSYETSLRLLRASHYIRVAGYCTAKALVAFFSFQPPQGVSSYVRGWTMMVTEGVLLPGASVLPPSVAVVVLSLMGALSAKMRFSMGAVDSCFEVVLYSTGTVALGLFTTTASQVYLRYHFLRRSRNKRDWPGSRFSVSAGEASQRRS